MPSIFQLAIPVARAIEKWKSLAPTVPVPTVMAIAHKESTFNPQAKNPNSTALGPFQVLAGSLAQYGLTSPDQRTDVDRVTKGAVMVFAKAAADVDKVFPGLNPAERSGWIYLAHWQGPGALRTALALVKQKGLTPTVESAAKVLDGLQLKGAKRPLKVPVGPMADVRRYYKIWDQARADLGGDWSGLVAWGESPRGSQTVLASRGSRRKPTTGGGGGGGVLVFGLLGLGLLAALAKH